MLKSLSIKNYAIIDDLTINFNGGLSIITGETGAGKSILLGALGLVMGNRADSTVLFDKHSKCIVEAKYDIRAYNLKRFFENNDLDYDQTCIIRREIGKSGKSRAFINDTPVILEKIKSLSSQLLDLHQQFDTQEINQEEFQISALDSLGGNVKSLEKYSDLYRQYREKYTRLNQLIEKSRNALQESDYIQFQLSEFEGLNLKSGEVEDLENEQNRLSRAEDIMRTGALLSETIDNSETSIISSLETLLRELSPLTQILPKAQQIYERLFSVTEELRDISSSAYEMSENEEYDATRVENIEQRLNTINRLLNKHKVVTDQDLMIIEEKLINQLEKYENVDVEIDELKTTIKELEEKLFKIGFLLSEKRKKGASKLEKNVNKILSSLSMKNAQLKVDVKQLTTLRKNGTDEVLFLFSANKGSTFHSIAKVASGGELSRLNLALKSTIAGALTLPTLIFDEIDSGVSGQVSIMMGTILKSLSKEHQTICITHSPQIAAHGDAHYHMYKTDIDDRTIAHVTLLSDQERKLEIAKMLSGDPPSNEAINNAKQLLEITI